MKRELIEKAGKVKFFLLDVDGVLTDGSLYYDDEGNEWKVFHIHDGHGLRLLKEYGIKAGFLSGRKSKAVEIRARELGIHECHLGIDDKLKKYEELLKKHKLKDDAIAYMGDDLADLPVLKRAGLSISVADGMDKVKDQVDWVTKKPGGKGAVREAVDFILSALEGEEKGSPVGFIKR